MWKFKYLIAIPTVFLLLIPAQHSCPQDLTHDPDVCRAYGLKTLALYPGATSTDITWNSVFRLEPLGPVLNFETVSRLFLVPRHGKVTIGFKSRRVEKRDI
jgi:hypothetical protein